MAKRKSGAQLDREIAIGALKRKITTFMSAGYGPAIAALRALRDLGIEAGVQGDDRDEIIEVWPPNMSAVLVSIEKQPNGKYRVR